MKTEAQNFSPLAAARFFGTPLMVDSDKAAVVAKVFGPRFLGLPSGADINFFGVASESAGAHEARTPSLLAETTYQDAKQGGGYPVRSGVAVIAITGTLVRRGAFIGEHSGVTSYEGIAAQLRAAAEDDTVVAVALEIDSFGGEAAGIFDLAAQIRALRSAKPVHAFVSDYALSAGYAIASQADQITVPPFGKVGSIGVVMLHENHSDRLENEGVEISMIYSGAKKVDGNPFEKLSDEVRQRLQKESDEMWVSFAGLVEQGRGKRLSAESALRTQAAVYTGADAVAAGLADEVAEARVAFDSFLKKLGSGAAKNSNKPQSSHQSACASGDLVARSSFDAKLIAKGSNHSPGCMMGRDARTKKEIVMSNENVMPVAESPAEDQSQVASVLEASADAVQEERTRAAKIAQKCAQAGVHASVGQSLIADGVSLAEAYERILDEKAARAQDGGDIVSATSAAVITSDVVDRTKSGLSAALYARAGLDGGERNEFTGMSLREMARVVLSSHNLNTPSGGVMALAGAAFSPAMVGAAHSTSDFGNILADVANKSMLKGFSEAEETFEKFTSVGSLTDFRETKRVGLDAFPSLDKVQEGAEFKYGKMGDFGEAAVLATYGALFAITRQTIINDDLDAISKLPMKMGRAARRTVGDLVFAVLTGNPTMSDGIALFNAAHNNLASSGGAPSEASINEAITAMATQKSRGESGVSLNIPPKFIIAPPKHRSAVLQALNSEYAPDDTSKVGSAKQPRAYNTVRNAAEPIFDARIGDDSWFVAADSGQFDVIEVSYLDGISQPFLDQQSGWGVDGTEFKVRIDAAATALAWESLYKNDGVVTP